MRSGKSTPMNLETFYLLESTMALRVNPSLSTTKIKRKGEIGSIPWYDASSGCKDGRR